MVLPRMYWINDKVAGGCIPLKDDYQKLRNLNIKIIISLVEDWEYEYYADMSIDDVYRIVENLDMKIYRYPTKDGYSPDEYTLLDICKKIEKSIQDGYRVYVHCVGGLGRTPTVLSAYLIYSNNLECEEALRIMMNINPDMSITEDQYYALKTFELYIKNIRDKMLK